MLAYHAALWRVKHKVGGIRQNLILTGIKKRAMGVLGTRSSDPI